MAAPAKPSADGLHLPEDGSVQKAIADIRSNAHKPAAFVVLGFTTAADSHALAVVHEADGSIAEALPHIPDDQERYILIRKDTKVEMANTVKFVFIAWVPSTVKPMRKAFLSTVYREVQKLVKPFHVELNITDKKELTEEMILKEIGLNSGTVSRERAVSGVPAGGVASAAGAAGAAGAVGAAGAAAAAAAPAAPSSPKSGSAPRSPKLTPAELKTQQHSNLAKAGAATITFTDEASFRETLKNIRNDKDPTNWLLCSSAGKGALSLIGHGSGGVDEFLTKLEDDNANFGLIRVTEVLDGKAKATKFVHVIWQPDSLKPMKRAELSALKGALESVFRPYHVEHFMSKKTDLSDKVVMDLVASASGAKSHVVDKH